MPYFAWAGAEIAVALVCTGIPTLRPLYIKARGLTSTHGSHNPRKSGSHLPQYVTREVKAISASPVSDAKVPPYTNRSPVTYPPPSYSSHNIRRDSVEELISGYHDRNTGVIWVRSEVHVLETVAEWPLKN